MRDRAFGVLRRHGLPQTVRRVSANRRVNAALVLHEIVINKRCIPARDAVRGELR